MIERCDVVAAEDTRVTQRLLQAYGLQRPMMRADRHREQSAAAVLLEHLAQGHRVAYISDAGTPGINDPGAALAHAARAAGHQVIPLPGASSVIAALSASGLSLDAGYAFVGYVPASAQQRAQFWREALASPRPVVCFEAPHRIEASLASLEAECGNVQVRVILAKELTKQFESIVDGTPTELLRWLCADPRHAHGEFVLLLDPPPRAGDVGAEAQQWLLRLARELPASRAAAVVAEVLGADRKSLYRWLLARDDTATP